MALLLHLDAARSARLLQNRRLVRFGLAALVRRVVTGSGGPFKPPLQPVPAFLPATALSPGRGFSLRQAPSSPRRSPFTANSVLDPNQRPLGLPFIAGDGAYAYRLYRLARHWNEYLSGRAADSAAALFAGEVVAEPSRRGLYVPVEPAHRLVSPDYTPALEVEASLDQLLVGVVAASGSVSDGSVNTPLRWTCVRR